MESPAPRGQQQEAANNGFFVNWIWIIMDKLAGNYVIKDDQGYARSIIGHRILV